MNCLTDESKETSQEINGFVEQNIEIDSSCSITIKTESVNDVKPSDVSMVKEELFLDSTITDNCSYKYSPTKTDISPIIKNSSQLIKEETEIIDLPETDIKVELADESNEPPPSVPKISCNTCNMTFLNQQIQRMHFNLCHPNLAVPTEGDSTVNRKSNKTKCKRLSVATMKKLIECVRSYPCLYDAENDEYNNAEFETLSWGNIAADCNLPNGIVAKAEWRKLKTRVINSLIVDHRSTPAIRTQRQWQYKKQMEFLLPYLTDNDIHSVQRIEEIPPTELQEAVEINDEPIDYYPLRSARLTHKESPNLKRKRLDSVEPSTSSNAQPLDMFFLSMCATTKNLPSYVQLQVKKKIFQAVIEAEEIVAAMHNDQAKNNIFPDNESTQNEFENDLSPFSIQSNPEEEWHNE